MKKEIISVLDWFNHKIKDFNKSATYIKKLLVQYENEYPELYSHSKDYKFANSLPRPFKVSVNTILPLIVQKETVYSSEDKSYKTQTFFLRGDVANYRLQQAIVAKVFILDQIGELTPSNIVCESLKLYTRITNLPFLTPSGEWSTTLTFKDFASLIINAFEHHTYEDIHVETVKDLTYKPKTKFQWDYQKHFAYSFKEYESEGLKMVYWHWSQFEYPAIYASEIKRNPNTTLKSKAPSFTTFQRILKSLRE